MSESSAPSGSRTTRRRRAPVREAGIGRRAQALSAHRVSKQYGGIHALEQAELAVEQAEIHALLGEKEPARARS